MAVALPVLAAWNPASAARKPSSGPLNGVSGEFLAGRFALSQQDADYASEALLRGYAADPGRVEIAQQAFAACLTVGRPEVVRLARTLPDNQAAQLLLAGAEGKASNWEAAEQRYRSISRQGFVQFLQPILVAWAQQGGGHTDAALATLRPLVEGSRLRGIYAMHAGMIADLGERPNDAARLYRIARTEAGGVNLRLGRVIASWQARTGHLADAQQTIRALSDGNDELSIAIPALVASVSARPVVRASDGIAEAYLAFVAPLRQQDQADAANTLLRLALFLKPDLSAARLIVADGEDGAGNSLQALKTLAPVPATDPLISVVRLRRAMFTERAGNSEDAARDLEQIGRDYPDSPLPLAQLGDLLRGKNRYAEAIGAYDRAIGRVRAPQRSAWPLFYARGISQERSGNWTMAQADLERALQLAPDQPYVLNYLGYSWADQGQHLAQAKQMLTRALELRPSDGSIVDSLGWLQLRQGDTKAAVASLERAVEMLPEDATINGHLGDAYWAVGRKREAQFQWRRALVLNPEAEEAAKLQTKLSEVATQAETSIPTAEHRVQ